MSMIPPTEPAGEITPPTSILIIDGTNIEMRCRDSFNRVDIDFRKFFAMVSAGTRLIETHYFTAPLPRDYPDRAELAAQSGRFNVLRSIPNTQVVLGRYKVRERMCRACGHVRREPVEKGTDVAAAIKIVECAIRKSADVIFLLAGDNDYKPAMAFARAQGAKLVLGYVINPRVSLQEQRTAVADLRHNCDRQILLDEAFMAGCWRPV